MRSSRERVLHTLLFEIIAVAIMTPAFAAFTGASTAHSGTLSVAISIGAVMANYIWTLVFDRWVPTRRRSLGQRFLQAAGLEAIIAVYTIPLVMGLTGATIRTAVALDAAALVFFLVYGMLYNAAFDAVMRRLDPPQSVSSSGGSPS